MTRKTRVYVAGPYTKGDVAMNVRNAIIAANNLMDEGYSPYVPHFTHFQHIILPRPYQDWIDQDNEWVPVCDVLLRLPGESSGGDDEVALAKSLNIPVYYNLEHLMRCESQEREQ